MRKYIDAGVVSGVGVEIEVKGTIQFMDVGEVEGILNDHNSGEDAGYSVYHSLVLK